jgi:hydroxymethylpyrimidine pyrophosphatase-like HAD family hydrolase
MNSKQINFFLAPEDLPKVITFINENGGVIYKRHADTKDKPVKYNLLINEESIIQVCVCKEEYTAFLSFEYLQNRKEFYIEIGKSNCIEFSFGGFYPYSDKELHRSRFYFVTKYYEGDELVKKDEEFLAWADDVLKKFKKQFLIKAKELSDYYVTANFIEWVKKTEARPTPDGTKFVIK